MATLETFFPVVARRAVKVKESCSQSVNVVEASAYSTRVPQKISSAVLTKELISTLSDELNPITHSDIYERTDHIVSFSTGHQVSSGRHRDAKNADMKDRKAKLSSQHADIKSHSKSNDRVLNGTRIYIDGYLENTTDIEMKRLVVEAGGEIVRTASQCTHILTSRGLSASKTHVMLTKKRRTNVHVVKPDWVLDSISVGKKRPERSYSIVKQPSTLHNSFVNPSRG